VRLNYEIPANWVERLGLAGLNVFVTADNLYTWTKYSGLDPEINFDNAIFSSPYPISKRLLFGLNVGL
jgi:hypothetical protein